MSEARQTDDAANVDQSVRAQQVEEDTGTPDEADVIESMRQQLAELEERDRQRDDEIRRERAQRESERRAREEAERRAREAETRAQSETETSRRSAEDAQLDAIRNSIEARNAQMESLQRDYAAAFGEGDGAKLAGLQAQMAKIGAQITTLENGKAALEARKATPQTAEPQQRQSSEADNQETFIRGQPPLVQSWLRQHREKYFGDQSFQKRVAAAASYATEIRGIAGDSQAFIDYVEQEVGMRERPQSNGRDADPKPQSNNNRMITAPAGGSTPGTARGGERNGQVYLTRDEKAWAAQIGVSEAEYAKHKLDLTNEGEIGPKARGR